MLLFCRQILSSRRALFVTARTVVAFAVALSVVGAGIPQVLVHSHEHSHWHAALDAGSVHDHDHAPASEPDVGTSHLHDATPLGAVSVAAAVNYSYALVPRFAPVSSFDAEADPTILAEPFFRPPILSAA